MLRVMASVEFLPLDQIPGIKYLSLAHVETAVLRIKQNVRVLGQEGRDIY